MNGMCGSGTMPQPSLVEDQQDPVIGASDGIAAKTRQAGHFQDLVTEVARIIHDECDLAGAQHIAGR